MSVADVKKNPGLNLGESRSNPPARAARKLRLKPVGNYRHNTYTIVHLLNIFWPRSIASADLLSSMPVDRVANASHQAVDRREGIAGLEQAQWR